MLGRRADRQGNLPGSADKWWEFVMSRCADIFDLTQVGLITSTRVELHHITQSHHQSVPVALQRTVAGHPVVSLSQLQCVYVLVLLKMNQSKQMVGPVTHPSMRFPNNSQRSLHFLLVSGPVVQPIIAWVRKNVSHQCHKSILAFRGQVQFAAKSSAHMSVSTQSVTKQKTYLSSSLYQ